MATELFEQFVRLPNFFYKTAGLRAYDKPGVGKQTSIILDVIFYVNILNINMCLLYEYAFVYFAFTADQNFVDGVMAMSYIGFVTVGEVKLLAIWLKQRQLTGLMQDLWNLFPKSAALQTQYNLRDYLQRSSYVTKAFSLLYMILIWTYNLVAIVQYLVYERWLHIREVGQSLPYLMYIPWEYRGHWSYYVLYASANYAGYTCAAGQISSDLLLCALTTQVIMHYDRVARSIEEYAVQAGDEKGCRKDLEFLQGVIAQHEKLLSLTDVLNDVFGLSLFFSFMTSSVVICFVGFQITIGADTESTIKLFMFLFSSMAEVYLICHYGQLLIDASTNIAAAVYNHDWSKADVRYKKMLLLMARRSQKPAVLKATTFISISRGTMTDIMQISYKFYALLRTMYVK